MTPGTLGKEFVLYVAFAVGCVGEGIWSVLPHNHAAFWEQFVLHAIYRTERKGGTSEYRASLPLCT